MLVGVATAGEEERVGYSGSMHNNFFSESSNDPFSVRSEIIQLPE